MTESYIHLAEPDKPLKYEYYFDTRLRDKVDNCVTRTLALLLKLNSKEIKRMEKVLDFGCNICKEYAKWNDGIPREVYENFLQTYYGIENYNYGIRWLPKVGSYLVLVNFDNIPVAHLFPCIDGVIYDSFNPLEDLDAWSSRGYKVTKKQLDKALNNCSWMRTDLKLDYHKVCKLEGV